MNYKNNLANLAKDCFFPVCFLFIATLPAIIWGYTYLHNLKDTTICVNEESCLGIGFFENLYLFILLPITILFWLTTYNPTCEQYTKCVRIHFCADNYIVFVCCIFFIIYCTFLYYSHTKTHKKIKWNA
jgi:hypothetical protein